VTDAMERVDRGVFGLCEACHREIPDDRLEAVPATRFCVEHEALWELEQVTVHAGEPAFAEDVAAREGARHLELLPQEGAEDEDDDRLSVEESAVHVTQELSRASGPARG
jgi:hypothetical protein